MKRSKLQNIIGIMIMLALSSTWTIAKPLGDDTENKLVDARVVEIAERHISVIAQTGVEHVIAINREGTKVWLGERSVSLRDVHVDDVITIELDEANAVKFAKQIEIMESSKSSRSSEVARTPF
ncbi:MAG: hypothetical protein ACRD9R_07975 [Pyrinomonadaceae bacterium]